jgi:flavin-dependent dehydrogenase
VTLGHVVVIGGGIAGLFAARVLADRAEHVTVLERDGFPGRVQPRKGVPQGRHVHVFLVGGFARAAELLPGLVPALNRAGAVPVDWTRDARLLSAYGWYPRYPSGLVSRFCSRGLLEHVVREQVGDHPRIAFRTGCEVTGLSPGSSGAGGVRYRTRGAGYEPAEVSLPAQLIVDASGRESRFPRWLEALGFPRPPETVVDAYLGYATRMYQIPDGFSAGWRYLVVRNPLPQTRAGVVCPIEGGRWLVTLGGFSGDYPPHDEPGFLAFARSLATPEFAGAIEAAQPLTPAVAYRRTVNRLRHVERLPAWPKGFVALGDAVCAFNPIYGQGMSTATLAAVLLGAVVGDGGPDVERRFQRRLARLIQGPWRMAPGEDYRYPDTTGPARGPATRINQWYADQVMRAAVHDVRVHRAFVEVMNMVRPPSVLGRPGVAARVLRAGLARSRPFASSDGAA